MLDICALSVSIYHKDYWTVWVGRVGFNEYSDASLLMIGTRGRATYHDLDRWPTILGVRVEADILWLSFFVGRARRWWFNRKRKQELSRVVRVEANCICGHDIHSHTAPMAYMMVPCGKCECEEYMPAEHPYCECGHSGAKHAMHGPNLFLGCHDPKCDCEIYTPESAMSGIARLCQELMEEGIDVT
jgi:hypothetical protein